ncbi:helix-turn-helix transcriptional regulator [Brachyspira pilosicoli]|uniref:Transcriptional regulator n=1 Tax=Brachyspira pilosicoli TaxID=52584 RepID=A0A5C8FAP0_BRAPL|nr:helix-turn-helix transcriptional regulator [Brachyspira pilosicoli]TXJ46833.1 transcriptional regulator [Brachyspira pilosicoli]
MKTIKDILPLLEDIITGLGKQFGERCEFVIHDYSEYFDSTIVAIVNGEVTNRKVGMGGTNIGLKVLQTSEEPNGKFNYITQTLDGHFLRSSTIYLKNDKGEVIGSLCVNLDITELLTTSKILEKICMSKEINNEKIDTIITNTEDLLINLIQESINYIGVPVANMTRNEKIKGIQYLNKRGAMRIKNASNIIAKYYDISKYSVYNYINKIDQ